jgi:hypothetical protein
MLLVNPSLLLGDETVHFSRDILPILSENCFACHGFDEASRQADLRLDTPDGATAELYSGHSAIVPGQPAESLLAQRIETDDDDERMPPPESGKTLTSEQRALLRQWISQGAAFEKHWSLVPPRETAPPIVEGVEHPIDRFIQAKLEELGVHPAPVAENTTLLRRVS